MNTSVPVPMNLLLRFPAGLADSRLALISGFSIACGGIVQVVSVDDKGLLTPLHELDLLPEEVCASRYPKEWDEYKCRPIFSYDEKEGLSIEDFKAKLEAGKWAFHPGQVNATTLNPTGWEMLQHHSEIDQIYIDALKELKGDFVQIYLPEKLSNLLNLSDARKIINQWGDLPQEIQALFRGKSIILLSDAFWSDSNNCFFVPSLSFDMQGHKKDISIYSLDSLGNYNEPVLIMG